MAEVTIAPAEGPPLTWLASHTGSVTVVKSGSAVTITTTMGDGKTLVQAVNLATSANGGFEFGAVTYYGAQLSSCADDVCPIRTQLGTLGGNHGYSNVATFTNPDSKSSADLGSVWQDTAGREYVLLAVTAGLLTFGGDYTVDGDGIVSSDDVAPVTNLTHVSGATHTGAVNYTTKAATQLYPSTGARNAVLYIDGRPTAADGSYVGAVVEVRESYEILDYKALYDTAAANIGTSYSTLAVTGAVLVTNVFRWSASGLRITTTLDELQPTALAVCGAVQAYPISKSGATTVRYVPGVKSVAGSPDWGAGVDMTSYSTTNLITDTHLDVAGVPPAFHMDVAVVDSAPVVGFAMGYLPFSPDTASNNENRVSSAGAKYYDMRSTKKVYPSFTNAEAFGWGHLRVESYRIYLTGAQVSAVLASKGARQCYAALSAVTDSAA